MTTQAPLVSVIVIFYNSVRYLEEAIHSVFEQRFVDWELLLVDDGSDDGSTELARRYARDYPERVRCLEHPGHRNRGMSATRNLGIREARGTYLTFLDSDDVWTENPLAEQVRILEENPELAMVYGATLWWHGWKARPGDAIRDRRQDLGVTPEKPVEPPELLAMILQNEAYNPAGGLWRKAFMESIGGYEEQFRGMYEDQVFLAKTLLRAPVLALDACWYKYRQHSGGCCVRAIRNGRYPRARQAYLHWLKAYMRREGLADPGLQRIIDQQLSQSTVPYFLFRRALWNVSRLFPTFRLWAYELLRFSFRRRARAEPMPERIRDHRLS